MQKLKSKLFEKLQIENKVQYVKALPSNRVFQSGASAVIVVGLLSWLHIRPLGLLFFIIFSFWFLKTYCDLRIRTPPKLENHINRLLEHVVEFRKRRPIIFSASASALFGILALLGTCTFVGVSIMAIILSIVIMSLQISSISERELRRICEQDKPESYSESLQEANEVFANELGSDLSIETLATDNDDSNDEDKSDEVPSELLIADSLPEIDENSTDDDQDDLLPVVESDKITQKSESPTDIKFNTGHFKRDSSLSSTSSEESLSKGLQFPDFTAVVTPKSIARNTIRHQDQSNDLVAMAVNSQTQALIAHSSGLLPNLMNGLVQGIFGMSAGALPTQSGPVHQQTNRRIVTALDSSDDSDFEILEQDDFQ